MAESARRLLSRGLACLSVVVAVALGGASPALAAGQVTSIRAQEWWLTAMHASDTMWPISTGKGMTIAEIDSGVDTSHPDLVGQVSPGQNFSGLSGGPDADAVGHGTAMASLMVGTGVGLNGSGMYGLAPGARIISFRISPQGATEVAFGEDFARQMSEAIRAAANSKAQIISISMGQMEDEASVLDAVQYAQGKGKMIVAAVGDDGDNGNELDYPAAFPGVVAVGETDSAGAVAKESEHGPQVSFTAPGAGMYVACTGPSGYCTSHGTSDSTAIASASAALIWSVHPTWTADQIIRVMMNSANRGTDKFGQQDPYFGYGALRPRVALVTPGDPGSADVNPLIPVAATQSAPSKASAPASTSPDGTAQKASSKAGSSSTSWVVVAVVAIVVIIVCVAVALILVRRRNRPGPPPPPEPKPHDPYAHLPG